MTIPPSRASRWLTLGIIGLGISISPLDSAVNIAFPAITEAFQIPLPAIQWVFRGAAAIAAIAAVLMWRSRFTVVSAQAEV